MLRRYLRWWWGCRDGGGLWGPRIAVAGLILLLVAPAAAQTPYAVPGGPARMQIQDEGTGLGAVRSLNFVGAGVLCVNLLGIVTCTIAGGAGTFGLTEVEIDFSLDPTTAAAAGSRFVQSKVVVDATVTATSKILAIQSGKAATGRQADENEMDEITCRATPGTGQFTLICSCARSVTHGLFKVQYTLG